MFNVRKSKSPHHRPGVSSVGSRQVEHRTSNTEQGIGTLNAEHRTMNRQPRTANPAPGNPQPATRNLLPVMESFYTLQGEGYHAGKAAYFIRLGGCDVGCHWCDVKESWDASTHPLVAVDELAERAEDHGPAIIVITGGEPLMYRLDDLTGALQSRGLKTHIETSGAHPLSGSWDWICFSPKKFKKPVQEIYQQAHELKVVIYNKHDFEWAKEHADKVNSDCKLYLQPEWSRVDQNMPLITEYIKTNPQWRMSIQSHKYLNLP